jgi:hypothetical protein
VVWWGCRIPAKAVVVTVDVSAAEGDQTIRYAVECLDEFSRLAFRVKDGIEDDVGRESRDVCADIVQEVSVASNALNTGLEICAGFTSVEYGDIHALFGQHANDVSADEASRTDGEYFHGPPTASVLMITFSLLSGVAWSFRLPFKVGNCAADERAEPGEAPA